MISTDKSEPKPSKRQIDSKVMSLTEACEYLGVAKVTMYKYLSEGAIKGFKFPTSRVWKFDRDDLDRWIEVQKGRTLK